MRSPTCPVISCRNTPNEQPSASALQRICHLEVQARAQLVREQFLAWCGQRALQVAWRQEFDSEVLAQWLTHDLQRSCPQDVSELCAMAWAAADGKQQLPRCWLFILPDNHSIAGWHALLCAALLGLKIKVRLPARFADVSSALGLFLQWLHEVLGADVTILPPTWLLTGQEDQQFDSVLAFGADDTIAQLAAMTTRPIRCFGNRLALSLVTDVVPEQVQGLLRDSFSMRQRGCMNTRLAVLARPDCLEQLWTSLTASFFAAGLCTTPAEEVALDGERLRYRDLGVTRWHSEPGGPLLLAYHWDMAERSWSWLQQSFISRCPFVLPLVVMPSASEDSFFEFLRGWRQSVKETNQLTSNELIMEPLDGWQQRPLGLANAPRWDGTSDGTALFGV